MGAKVCNGIECSDGGAFFFTVLMIYTRNDARVYGFPGERASGVYSRRTSPSTGKGHSPSGDVLSLRDSGTCFWKTWDVGLLGAAAVRQQATTPEQCTTAALSLQKSDGFKSDTSRLAKNGLRDAETCPLPMKGERRGRYGRFRKKTKTKVCGQTRVMQKRSTGTNKNIRNVGVVLSTKCSPSMSSSDLTKLARCSMC